MATQSKTIDVTQVNGAAALSTRPRSIGSISSDYAAWLDQVTKVREKAFRLADARILKDGEVAPQLVGCNQPSVPGVQTACATKLTADYLVESEKMIELTTKLVQNGQLETRLTSYGHSIAKMQREA
jgi:hypothetical protein